MNKETKDLLTLGATVSVLVIVVIVTLFCLASCANNGWSDKEYTGRSDGLVREKKVSRNTLFIKSESSSLGGTIHDCNGQQDVFTTTDHKQEPKADAKIKISPITDTYELSTGEGVRSLPVDRSPLTVGKGGVK